MYYPPNQRLCLQSARYKFCNLTSFVRLRPKIKNINNISLKFIILTDNSQIFRDWFIIIHRHLTKVSARIIQSVEWCFSFVNSLFVMRNFNYFLYKCGVLNKIIERSIFIFKINTNKISNTRLRRVSKHNLIPISSVKIHTKHQLYFLEMIYMLCALLVI